jgi:nicotinamidase-related amidase
MAESSPTPERAPTVLLLVDVINPFDFEGAKKLLEHARPAAKRIAALKRRGKEAGVPAIYANDHFGRWRDDFRTVLERAMGPEAAGRDIVRLLEPEEDDYFVLKPRHSAFFGTPLDFLLAGLETRTLIVTGFASDICVLATLIDAKMRDFKLVMPADASAAESKTAHSTALAYARRVLDAETPAAAEVQFSH